MKLPSLPLDKIQYFILGAVAADIGAWISFAIFGPDFVRAGALTGAFVAGTAKEAIDHHINRKAKKAGEPPPKAVSFADFASVILGGCAVAVRP